MVYLVELSWPVRILNVFLIDEQPIPVGDHREVVRAQADLSYRQLRPRLYQLVHRELHVHAHKIRFSGLLTRVGSEIIFLFGPRPSMLSLFLPQTNRSPLLVRQLEDSSKSQ